MADPSARRSALRRLSWGFLLAGVAALVVSSAWGAGLPARMQVPGSVRGAGTAVGSSGPTNLSVNLTDAPSFDPNNLVAPPGAAVTFHLDNIGALAHTFTILGVAGLQLPSNATPGALDRVLADNGTIVNVSLAGGTTGIANFSVPDGDAGYSFEIVSAVPYQFQAGMHGFFNVTAAPKGPPLDLNETTIDTFAFVPAELNASTVSSYPVAIHVLVTNQGSLSHTFTVAAQANVSLDSSSFSSYFTANPPAVNVNVPSGSGGQVWANFTVSGPGVYEYICEVVGHFSNGMFGFLYVGVPTPATAAAVSTALVQPALLAGAGVLLGIGALLALGAAFTGRFPKGPSGGGAH